MPRTSTPAEDRLGVTELIERISAEHGAPAVRPGRHRRGVPQEQEIPLPRPAAPPASRPTGGRSARPVLRRLAPLGVGALVMVVATTVAVTLRPSSDEAAAEPPELSAALVGAPAGLGSSAAAGTSPAVTAPTVPEPTTRRAAAGPTVRSRSAAPTPDRERSRTAAPEPAPPAEASAAAAGDGTQAAAARGWTLIDGDEFDGGLSGNWGKYDGPGHGGNGRRTPDAITVRDGVLVIRGDGDGDTGGMAWSGGRKYGKWEVRAKFPKGDAQYHPVLLLWPDSENWPEDGEVDFAETDSAADDVKFFLHYGADNSQESASKKVDITQWHNYAVEWTPSGVFGYLDGEKWFESTDPDTLPPGEMHLTIQLDYFPKGGSPDPTEMYVDYVRIYA